MTDITVSTRLIKDPSQLPTCEKCGAIVDNSCTDALQQIDGSWSEGPERFGCKQHPVEPMIYFLDGDAMTAKEYARPN